LSFTDGYVIDDGYLDAVWSTGLQVMRARTSATSRRKQWPLVVQFRGVTTSTARHLRTHIYTPRTDVAVVSATISAHSAGAGIVCSVNIPAQILERERITGGNIPYALTGSATTSGTATAGIGTIGQNSAAIPATTRLMLLAGDNIDIIAQVDSATAADVTVVLLLEGEVD